jgi:septal ring factor EnvC (AmiA/AmiB activator)
MESNMATCAEASAKESGSYRSPWRVLARAFEKSRDRWKEKYKQLQERIKAIGTELRDLRRSRERWRADAEALRRELDELKAEMRRQAEQSPPAPSRRRPQLANPHWS